MLADARQWFLVPQGAAWPAPSQSSCGCAARAATTPDLLNTLAAYSRGPVCRSPRSSPAPAPLASAASSGPTAASHSNSTPFSSQQIRPNWISAPTALGLRPWKNHIASQNLYLLKTCKGKTHLLIFNMMYLSGMSPSCPPALPRHQSFET
jgi:hypothetical protein